MIATILKLQKTQPGLWYVFPMEIFLRDDIGFKIHVVSTNSIQPNATHVDRHASGHPLLPQFYQGLPMSKRSEVSPR